MRSPVLAQYVAHSPDVAVIDLNLPGVSGFELSRRILGHDADAKIIFFSMNDDAVFAARSIDAGAKGYITKNDDPSDFTEAVLEVARGGVYLRPEIARKLAFLTTTLGTDPLSKLTAREIEILRLLSRGKSLTEIAHVVSLSYKTVANCCSTLKHKLGARTSTDLVRIAFERGLGRSGTID